ncbi:hypothetical protein G7Y89_g6677 [Cudoniella acicularis]|uniref:JmjC domain-containing protein n=1 Tax=Cudoniella acicularis TaxID=354080 RepID=A0A8H4RLT7_9HELO|nr:hypothetical protein G7Y89_g6677 [Cudoniella acicularis]
MFDLLAERGWFKGGDWVGSGLTSYQHRIARSIRNQHFPRHCSGSTVSRTLPNSQSLLSDQLKFQYLDKQGRDYYTHVACAINDDFLSSSGSPQTWIIIPPASKTRFEHKIRESFADEGRTRRSQFVSHLFLWIDAKVLRDWNIEYYNVTREVGQLLFIFPDTYFCGYSPDFSIIETKLYARNQWTFNDYQFCDARCEVYCGSRKLVNLETADPPDTIPVALPHSQEPQQGTKRKLSDRANSEKEPRARAQTPREGHSESIITIPDTPEESHASRQSSNRSINGEQLNGNQDRKILNLLEHVQRYGIPGPVENAVLPHREQNIPVSEDDRAELDIPDDELEDSTSHAH